MSLFDIFSTFSRLMFLHFRGWIADKTWRYKTTTSAKYIFRHFRVKVLFTSSTSSLSILQSFRYIIMVLLIANILRRLMSGNDSSTCSIFIFPKWIGVPFHFCILLRKLQEYWNWGYRVDPPRGSAPFYRTQLAKRNDSVIIFRRKRHMVSTGIAYEGSM